MPAWLRADRDGGSRLCLHVQPGASRSEVAGEHGDALKVRIRAPAVEGAANAALIAFLAERLDTQRQTIKLISGDTSRRKQLWLPLPPEETLRRLEAGHG